MDELMYLEIGTDEWWARMAGECRHRVEFEKLEPCPPRDEEQ